MAKKLNNKVIALIGTFKYPTLKMSGWITHNGGAYVQPSDPALTHCVVSNAGWRAQPDKLRILIEEGKVKIVSYDWLEDVLQSERAVKEKEYLWRIIEKKAATERAKARTAALAEVLEAEDEDEEIADRDLDSQGQRASDKGRTLSAAAELEDPNEEVTERSSDEQAVAGSNKGQGKAAASKPRKAVKAVNTKTPKPPKTQAVRKARVTKAKAPKKPKAVKKELIRPDATAHFAKRLQAKKNAEAAASVDTTHPNEVPDDTESNTPAVETIPTPPAGPIGVPEGYQIYEEDDIKWDALLLRIHNSARNERFFLRIFQNEVNTERYQVGLRYSGGGYKHSQVLAGIDGDVDLVVAKASFGRAYRELTGQDFGDEDDGLFVAETVEAEVFSYETSEIKELEGMPDENDIREKPFVHYIAGRPRKMGRVDKGKGRAE